MSRGYSWESEELDVCQHARVADKCDAFEAAWRANTPQRIEDLIANEFEPVDRFLLAELLLLELVYRDGAKEDDFYGRFPQVADSDALIDEVFDATRQRSLDGPQERDDCECKPKTIHQYCISEELGKGGFGVVYLAWDTALKRQVAIKCPILDDCWSPDDTEKFLIDARQLAQLSHPAIVVVHEAGQQDDGTPFIVMEYFESGSLDDLIRTRRMACGDAVRLVIQIAEAVGYIHSKGIFHRDLKPANILLDSQGYAHVADFGLAIKRSNQRKRAGEQVGSPRYMSPEQLRGESDTLDGRTDIWALGVILYEAITGHRPFASCKKEVLADEIMNHDPTPPRQLDNRVSNALSSVCLKCLEKHPNDRYVSAYDLAKALRKTQTSVRNKVMIVCGIAVMLLSAIGIYLIMQDGINPAEPPSQIDVIIEVRVWELDNPNRQAIPLRERGALPLKAGDGIRIDAELSHPAFVYIVWIDTNGKALPVYPWKPGTWDRAANETPVDQVTLPEQIDKSWPLEGGPGMETLLVLTRKTPLPSSVDIQKLFDGLPVTSMQHPQALVEFADGKLITDGGNGPRDRGLRFFDPQVIDDPVLIIQQRLYERLVPHFTSNRAISFANEGGSPEPLDPSVLAARWVLEHGGKVKLLHGPEVASLNDLPKGNTFVIHQIELRGCASVTDSTLKMFSRLPDLGGLSIGHTRISDEGLVHLSERKSLRWLTLGGTDVSDQGLERLRHLTGLELLRLTDTEITDGGLVHLLEMKNLAFLTLSGTQISDAGLTHLAKLKKLESLDLERTNVTSVGTDKLQDALPNCEIHRAE